MTQVELAKDQVPEQLPRRRKLQYDALLVLVTIIWGGNFLVVKDTLKLIGPFTFLALYYAVGALVLAAIFRKRLARITRAELIKGIK